MIGQDPSVSHNQRPGAQRVPSNHDPNARVSSAPPEHEGQLIVDVNRDNFEEETIKIMKLLGKYTTVAVDIEFPGIVFGNPSETFSYSNIKQNADALKIIQVGLSFADDNGVPPPGTSSWQFNLRFDLRKDLYAKESIEMLQAAGINFENHAIKGIEAHEFAEWLCVSNLPFNEDIKWICFSGSFDFTYLLRLLSNEELPQKEDEFYKKLKLYFPTFYDVKYMIESFDGLKFCGLSRLAIELGVARIGQGHQAGSDCLLTVGVFFKVKEKYLRGHIDNYIHANVLAGLKGDSDTPKDYYNGQDAPTLFADYSAAFVQQNAAAFMNYPPVVLRQPNGAMGMYPFYPEFQMAGGKVAPGANGAFNMLYGGLYPMSDF